MQVIPFLCVFILDGALFGDDVKKIVSDLIIYIIWQKGWLLRWGFGVVPAIIYHCNAVPVDKPACIYNIDEKGITQKYSPPQAVSGVDSKPSVISWEVLYSNYLRMCKCTWASYPQYFVFPGVRRRQGLIEGATPGDNFEMSESGWSNSSIFQNYLENNFLQYAIRVEEGQRTLLLYHRSHISPYLIDWRVMNNVILYVLPPHASHILHVQPLDVGWFGPLSKLYSNECHKYQREHGGAVNRYIVCALACRTCSLALSPQNVQSGNQEFILMTLLISRSQFFAPGISREYVLRIPSAS